MKTLFYLSTCMAILINISCSKKDSIDGVGEPKTYNIYFEVLKNDSTSFEEGDVEISEPMEMIDGQLIYPGDELRWQTIKIDTPVSEALNRTIFEPIVFTSWSSEWNFSGQNEWELDTYYLIRYLGNEIDTLRINDNTIVKPRNQIFKFLLNEEIKKEIIITAEGQTPSEPWVLLIQK